ncbi:hypothetical protein [Brevibacterium litoralis]|uniref:hypothetical protein n=1 Tax=Brevibacterium litoralis TaxID=3138935 RepID=UPI0032EAD993
MEKRPSTIIRTGFASTLALVLLSGCNSRHDERQAFTDAVGSTPGVIEYEAQHVEVLPFTFDSDLSLTVPADPDVLGNAIDTACSTRFRGEIEWTVDIAPESCRARFRGEIEWTVDIVGTEGATTTFTTDGRCPAQQR